MPNLPLKPTPDEVPRRNAAASRRDEANKIAQRRLQQSTKNNGEPQFTNGPTSFHKGLPHNKNGIVDEFSFDKFKYALNRDGLPLGTYSAFDVPLGPSSETGSYRPISAGPSFGAGAPFVTHVPKEGGGEEKPKVRNFESALGGHAFDIQGPDAGDLAMAAAPALGQSELTAELAEVYAMALLRDVPFSAYDQCSGSADTELSAFDVNGTQAGPAQPTFTA